MGSLKSEEKIDAVIDQIQIITQDLKTLEKQFILNQALQVALTSSSDNLNEDVLTKHLLRLNEIEEQFRELQINLKKLILKLTNFQQE